MNNKKHIMNLEYFKEMLQICPKLPNQTFKEPPFEQEILTFLRNLGHSREIKMITDVNVNKMHQPWRSFAANVDYAYLLWEDFICQVEMKNAKKGNEMYYPHFTKVVSRHKDTQLYGVILPDELTNEAIKNSKSYKEYYAIALGAEPPKTNARPQKKKDDSDTTPKKKPAKDTKGKRLKTLAKATEPAKKKQPIKTSKDKGLTVLSEKSSDEEDVNEVSFNDDDDDNDNDDDDDNDNDDDDDDDNQDDDD
ncbi:hypothetical protein Tco_1042119 [Tanacetum coccineum]|uniref:Uncharacterized protein n=1 Tax=Tanacetum coccineum TaxID=301880 RepID=A0ABQ5GJM3_9ASTR